MDKPIADFANKMQVLYDFVTEIKGYSKESWKDYDIIFIRMKFEEELEEYNKSKNPEELIDVALMSMILYYKLTNYPEPYKKEIK